MEVAQGQLLIPVPSACARLGGLSRTTIYELVKQGEIIKVNIGRRGFITADSIADYIKRLTSPTAEQIPSEAQ